AYSQATRTSRYVRREQACKPERHRDARSVIHRAFAMGMAVDMGANHDPIRASARQVGNQHARPRGIIIAIDDHPGSWERAVRRTAERLRRFDTDAERRDAGAAVASTRPRYGANAGFRMRDQKPDRAHLLRQPQLDAAVHVPGRERIFVADHDDPAADVVLVPLEILMSAQTDIEDFPHYASRRCRTQKWRAVERNARRRTGQLRRPAPPTWISHGIVTNLGARHGCKPPPGEGQSRSFAR